MVDYFYERNLENLCKGVGISYELVFVSSCTSEFAGMVFKQIANHVICIKDNMNILDEASIRFAKVFYETLFTK